MNTTVSLLEIISKKVSRCLPRETNDHQEIQVGSYKGGEGASTSRHVATTKHDHWVYNKREDVSIWLLSQWHKNLFPDQVFFLRCVKN